MFHDSSLLNKKQQEAHNSVEPIARQTTTTYTDARKFVIMIHITSAMEDDGEKIVPSWLLFYVPAHNFLLSPLGDLWGVRSRGSVTATAADSLHKL